MGQLTSTALRALRNRFGDRTDDILALRDAGHIVRPYGVQFVVGLHVVDADGLERLANELRARQAATAKRKSQRTAGGNPPGDDAGTSAASRAGSVVADPSDEHSNVDTGIPVSTQAACGSTESRRAGPKWRTPSVLPSEGSQAGSQEGEPSTEERGADKQPRAGVAPGPQDTIAAACACGRPEGHGGRCWHRRGLAAPVVPKARGKHPMGTCATCGGLRSYWSASQCKACYRKNPPLRLSQEQRIAALEREIANVKADLAALTDNLRDALRELLARIDAGESR